MTEAEILKEIETLLQIARFVNSDYVTSPFETKVLIAIQDLINRKNAEIERLKKECNLAKYEKYKADILQAKAEAIKEVLEKVKALFPTDKNFTTISRFALRQIAKEMGVEL